MSKLMIVMLFMNNFPFCLLDFPVALLVIIVSLWRSPLCTSSQQGREHRFLCSLLLHQAVSPITSERLCRLCMRGASKMHMASSRHLFTVEVMAFQSFRLPGRLGGHTRHGIMAALVLLGRLGKWGLGTTAMAHLGFISLINCTYKAME